MTEARRLTPLVRLSLAGIHREYPNKIGHVLLSEADVASPRKLTPLFFGCFDWHSAVHAHWTLVRALGRVDELSSEITRALNLSFTTEHVQGELQYVQHPDRKSFELPYGMAWLVLLDAELASCAAPEAAAWRRTLSPLAEHAYRGLLRHFGGLRRPIRTGEHRQTAFALGLCLDAMRTTARSSEASSLAATARVLFGADRDGPLHLEPSAFDFLSPCLAQADTLRRVLTPADLAKFLDGFLPKLAHQLESLTPEECVDPSDGHESHLIGLNLTRAWMMEGVGHALPAGDPRRAPLLTAAERHASVGLAAVTGDHYAGAHWLGTFAMYLLTKCGAPSRVDAAPA